MDSNITLQEYNEYMKKIYDILKFDELVYVAINELNKMNNNKKY